MSANHRLATIVLAALAVAVSTIATAAPKKGAGGMPPPKSTSITEEANMGLVHIGPLPLPGKDKLSYVLLEAQLEVRNGKKRLDEVHKVLDLKPRVIGRIIEEFQVDRITSLALTAADIQDIKERIKEAANAACGETYIVDVLIVSLLVT